MKIDGELNKFMDFIKQIFCQNYKDSAVCSFIKNKKTGKYEKRQLRKVPLLKMLL